MKLLSNYILGFALVIGAQSVIAEEDKKPDAPVHVTVVTMNKDYSKPNLKLSPSNYPKGIYVIVKETFGERPKSAAIFAEHLRNAGFKIADKPENADAVFLTRSASINFKDIEENSSSISAARKDQAIGTIGAAVLSGGLSLLVSDFSFLSNKG